MKYLFIAAIAASSLMYGQKVDEPKPKTEAKAEAPKPEAKERMLTKEESAQLQISILKLHILNDKYKIEEYQSAIAPISQTQQSLRDSLCKSIGVPPDKIASECGIAGFNNEGDQIMGNDGRPIAQKVFRVPQQPVATK